MHQTITSGVMAGSAGEAADGVVQPAKVQAVSASRLRMQAVQAIHLFCVHKRHV